jgi:hypothetical protein
MSGIWVSPRIRSIPFENILCRDTLEISIGSRPRRDAMSLKPDGVVTFRELPRASECFCHCTAGKHEGMRYNRCRHLQGEQENPEIPVRGQAKQVWGKE